MSEFYHFAGKTGCCSTLDEMLICSNTITHNHRQPNYILEGDGLFGSYMSCLYTQRGQRERYTHPGCVLIKNEQVDSMSNKSHSNGHTFETLVSLLRINIYARYDVDHGLDG